MDKRKLEESRMRARKARRSIDSGRIGDSYHTDRHSGQRSGAEYSQKKDPSYVRNIIILLVSALVLGALAAWLIFGNNEEIFVEKKEAVESIGGALSEAGLEIHYIDVGQGACTLIICDGEAMLIDGGPDAKGTLVKKYLMDKELQELKYVVGTHYDADHIGGLDAVLYRLECGRVFLPDYECPDTKAGRDISTVLKEKLLEPVHPVTGDSYKLGNGYFTFISPADGSYEDENEYSLGLIFCYGDRRFIFTGDAPEEAENNMLSCGIDLRADVYLVGHHGSSTSSSKAFLEAVGPGAAVISCGRDNDYGHPHDSVLKRLEGLGITVYRTDLNGTIVLKSDGIKITFMTENGG